MAGYDDTRTIRAVRAAMARDDGLSRRKAIIAVVGEAGLRRVEMKMAREASEPVASTVRGVPVDRRWQLDRAEMVIAAITLSMIAVGFGLVRLFEAAMPDRLDIHREHMLSLVSGFRSWLVDLHVTLFGTDAVHVTLVVGLLALIAAGVLRRSQVVRPGRIVQDTSCKVSRA